MKKQRKFFFIGLGIAVLLTGAMVSLGVWALNSAEGTRVLFKALSIFSPVQIDAQKIQGRLRDELKLQGVRIRWPQGEIRADRLHLHWQVAELMNRRVIVNELSLEGVVFQDRAPETQNVSFPGWPQVPLWLSKIQAKMESLRIQDLVYQRLNQEPIQLGQLLARGQWDENILEIRDFNLSGPSGRAEGTMKLSFAQPSLNLNLKTSLAKEYAGMDHLEVKLLMESTAKPEETAGTIWISGQKQNSESLRLEGELGLTPSALSWRNLRILQPGRKGAVESEGSWSFAVRPSLQSRLSFWEVDLAPELGMGTDLSGQVDIKGPLDNYRGQILFVNKAKGWLQGKASGEFQGDLHRVRINKLDADWMDGTVKGFLGFSWADGLALESRIQGAQLNPGKFHPEWNGELTLNLEGRILWRKDQLSEAVVKAHFSESRLRGQLFTGELNASLDQDLWKIAQLRVRGQGFALQAQGILQEKVQLEARITELSEVIPDAQGQILATGWLRYREAQVTGILHGQGNNLGWNKIRAGSFTADLQLKESPMNGQPAFDMESRMENLQIGSFPVKGFHLETSGVLKGHRAKLAFLLDGGEIEGEMEGGYESGLWKGTIARLTGKDAKGLWNLQAPAKIQLSAQRFLLDSLNVKSSQGERLQADANLALDPVSGPIQVEWGTLDLTRLNPWLREGKLSGRSTGSVSALWRKSGRQIVGDLSLKGAYVHDQIKVEVLSGQARCDWNEKGLLTLLTLNLKQGGNIEARISSTEALQTEPPQTGKIDLKWKGVDHGLISSLFPPKLILKGQSSGRVRGQWFPGFQIDAAGSVKVSRTDVVWQAGEKPVSFALQTTDLDFSWRGESVQGGIALTFADHGMVKGKFQLPLTARRWPSFHPEGVLNLAVTGRLLEKGFLAALYPEMIPKSRGNIDLDLRAEGTWKRPRFKGSLQIADSGIQISLDRKNSQIANGSDLLNLEVSSGSATLDWGDQGLRSSVILEFKNQGRVEGKLLSPEPAHFSLPKEGQMEMTWTALNLALLRPLWPRQISLEGVAGGQMKGNWLPDFRLEATGELKLAKGKFGWKGEKALISAVMNQGEANFSWREEGLQGNLSLSLETYGSVEGKFRLPLPARYPFQFDPARTGQASFRAQAQENGLLSAVFPGTVQESRGNMDLDLQVDGPWKKPNLKGTIQFTNAGAFLPGLGIRVEDLSTRCQVRNEQILIESFQARSGQGRIEGNGAIWLKNWEVQRYEGKIWGDKFQTFYLPDLRIQSSPKLNFQGDLKNLSVRGEVLLPEVLIHAVAPSGMVRPSSDVVIIDQPLTRAGSFSLDMEVRMVLGDRVMVKAGGIDARFAGNLDVKTVSVKSDQITARGEIRVVEGTYVGYGFNLRIDRGRLIFAGGPVDNPALDILALRRTDDLESFYDIKVGVTILGNLKRPIVKLYSIPAMKDEDILSYLVSGRPYDRQSANLSLLMMGAGALLAGDSLSTVDQLKSKMGIDKVDIESQSGDLSRSMVTIGKYLTPELYLSYGYSLFDSEQVLKVRYKISKSWEVEAQRGSAIAVDLYYRIDFF